MDLFEKPYKEALQRAESAESRLREQEERIKTLREQIDELLKGGEFGMTRWEVGFRNIVTVLIGPRTEFDIPEIVSCVRDVMRRVERTRARAEKAEAALSAAEKRAESLEAELSAERAARGEAEWRFAKAFEALDAELHCNTCEGTGEMSWSCPACDEWGYPQESCGACHGTGTEGPYVCAECDGKKLAAKHPESIEAHAALSSSGDGQEK